MTAGSGNPDQIDPVLAAVVRDVLVPLQLRFRVARVPTRPSAH